jgi:hypothetical protein
MNSIIAKVLNFLRSDVLWLVPACIAAFALGIGNNWWDKTREVANFSSIAAGLAFVIWVIQRPKRGQLSLGFLVLTCFFAGFLFLFYQHHNPGLSPQIGSMVLGDYWWGNFLKMSIAAFVLGWMSSTRAAMLAVTGAFVLLMFMLAASFGIATFFVQGHDFGGAVYNWLVGQMVNRAGALNLLIPLPVFLIAWAALAKRRKHLLLGVGVGATLAGVALCLVHESRSPILVLLVLSPIIAMLLYTWDCGLTLKTPQRQIGWQKIILVVLVIVVILGVGNATIFSERPMDFSLIKDARFTQFHRAFFQQLIVNPFQPAVVPEPIQYPWFHNFFADVHRSSGLYAFIASILLATWIIVRTLQWSHQDVTGKIMLATILPVFLIMNTSVVPEGEMQFFLLFVFLGALSERGIALKKMKEPV